MSHARSQIRDAFIAALNATDLLRGHVIGTQSYKVNEIGLPVVSVFCRSERQEAFESFDVTDPGTRTAVVDIQIHASAPDSPDDEIDAICVDIEKAVSADSWLQASVSARFESFELFSTADARRPTGLARVRYLVRYWAQASDPETICT